MTIFLVLPILIPMITAITLLFARRHPKIQQGLSLSGALLLLVATLSLLTLVSGQGIQLLQVGGWTAPFGITLVADLFSAIMVVLAAMMGLGVISGVATVRPGGAAY